MQVVYDIGKNKITVKAEDEKTQKDIKDIIIILAACATFISGFALYLDYRKDMITK